LLIGESATGPVVDRAWKTMESDPAVAAVESLRTMHMGPDHVVVTARIRFAAEQADVPEAISRLKTELAQVDPMFDDVTIEPASSK
jgi:uncharacterized protein YicC (UPF0701 family)